DLTIGNFRLTIERRAAPLLPHPPVTSAMRQSAGVILVFLGLRAAATKLSRPDPPPIEFNDGRTPAGSLTDGTESVSLVAESGEWRPYGPAGRGIQILAFGETGKALEDPGPMLRVPLGTHVVARIENRTGAELVVRGLSGRRSTRWSSRLTQAAPPASWPTPRARTTTGAPPMASRSGPGGGMISISTAHSSSTRPAPPPAAIACSSLSGNRKPATRTPGMSMGSTRSTAGRGRSPNA